MCLTSPWPRISCWGAHTFVRRSPRTGNVKGKISVKLEPSKIQFQTSWPAETWPSPGDRGSLPGDLSSPASDRVQLVEPDTLGRSCRSSDARWRGRREESKCQQQTCHVSPSRCWFFFKFLNLRPIFKTQEISHEMQISVFS